MSLSQEEIHKRTEANFKSISDQYNPNLKTFLMAGRAYEKALAGVAFASRQYFESMTKLGLIASDSASAKDLGASTREMAETFQQMQLHFSETVKFWSNEVISPLENKLENDTKYMLGITKKYQNDYRVRSEDLQRMTQSHKKIRQKSFNGKKPYKYDEKEKQLAETLALKQKTFDKFQHDKLEESFLEERRRYCFLVEQNCELVRRNIAYHQKSMEALKNQLPKWMESCRNTKDIPVEAAALLDSIKQDDTGSIYSIPEPPSEPAAQYNGYNHPMPNKMNNQPSTNYYSADDYNAPLPQPVNSTGHNVIPRENRKRVSAVFSHSVPGNPTQLNFEKGDEIILMIPQPRDGWHYGENDRTKQRGWFPYSYTKLQEQFNVPEKPQEPVMGHMPLPPADYNEPPAHQNGNGWHATPPQDNGSTPPADPYRQMKDEMLSGNPFANVQLRKTENGQSENSDNFSTFR